MKLRLHSVAGVVGLLMGLAAVTWAGWRIVNPAQGGPPAHAVVKVVRAPLVVKVRETGRVRPYSKVDLRSKVAGQVLKLGVEVGDRVRKGQVLLELDATESRRAFAQAEADLAMARAELGALEAGSRRQELAEAEARVREVKSLRDKAKDMWERARQAGAVQGLTAVELTEAAAERERTAAAYDAAKSRLAALRARVLPDEQRIRAQVRKAEVALRAAQEQIERAVMRSPVDGTVIQRGVEVGEMVTPGVAETASRVPLLTVANLSRLLVAADVNQIDVARLRLGLPATVRVDALPGEVFLGRVQRIAPAAVAGRERDVQLFPVSVVLEENKEGRLRPGMSADIDIEVIKREAALQLPVQAVRRGIDLEGRVTVVSADAAAGLAPQERQVRLGVYTDQVVEILEGLAEGESVLIDPAAAEGTVNRF